MQCVPERELRSKKERSVKSLYREILATPRSRLSRVDVSVVWHIQAPGIVHGMILCSSVTTNVYQLPRDTVQYHWEGSYENQDEQKTPLSHQVLSNKHWVQ